MLALALTMVLSISIVSLDTRFKLIAVFKISSNTSKKSFLPSRALALNLVIFYLRTVHVMDGV